MNDVQRQQLQKKNISQRNHECVFLSFFYPSLRWLLIFLSVLIISVIKAVWRTSANTKMCSYYRPIQCTAGYLPATRRARRRCWSLSESWWLLKYGFSPAHWREDQGRLEIQKNRVTLISLKRCWFPSWGFRETYIWAMRASLVVCCAVNSGIQACFGRQRQQRGPEVNLITHSQWRKHELPCI